MNKTTKNYGLPIIDPKAQFNGAEDINELARRVDHVMQHVEEVGKDSHYVLPPATKTSLGGVIPGDNVTVKEDGTISVNVNPYELPPASHSTLGGVIVPTGSGISLDPDGTIGIDNSSIGVPDGAVTTSKIADSAITTTKIANNAVTYEKASSSLRDLVDQMSDIINGVTEKWTLDTEVIHSAISNYNGNIEEIAGIYKIEMTFDLIADGSTKAWPIGQLPWDRYATRPPYGIPAICGYFESKTEENTVYPAVLSMEYHDSIHTYALTVTTPVWDRNVAALKADSYNVSLSLLCFKN